MTQAPLNPNYFNIDLIIPDDGYFKTRGLGEVTSLAIFEPNSDVFAKDGLFSPTIFGDLGTETRLVRPGYCDFKVKVLHPLIYLSICKLGKRYEGIMSGEVRAKFDHQLKDFVIDPDGETGYEFFISHLDKINYEQNQSKIRDAKIELVNKYGRSSGLINQMIIIPAGLRDYTVDENNSPSEDEINKLYRVLISLASRMKRINLTPEMMTYVDPIRYKIQRCLADIYRYIYSLNDGKSKFIQSKWSSRGCEYGTANVITTTPMMVTDLDERKDRIVGFNSTVVGLFQYLKALGPVVYNRVMVTFIGRLVGDDINKVKLINPTTGKLEYVSIKTKTRNDWSTLEGINGIVNKLSQDVIKNQSIKLDGYYLGLVLDTQVDNGNDIVRIFTNPDLIPEEFSLNKPENLKAFKETGEVRIGKSRLRPLKYVELFYISVLDCLPKFPAVVTRYPITGAGSIYPTMPYLKTTSKSRVVDWHIDMDTSGTATEYPDFEFESDYIRSQSVHPTHLSKLDADHDGDTMSFILIFSDEGRKEIENFFNSKEYYLDPMGEFNYSASTHVLDIALAHMTE